MCDYCIEILGSCVYSHDKLICPLKKALYCLNCNNYGHTQNECNNASFETIYLEHLISPKLLRHCQIKSLTPVIRSSVVGTYEKKELPEFIEELIPEFYLKKYKISSKTPLECLTKVYTPIPTKPVIDIQDHPKVIRDFLKSCNTMPKKQDRAKDKYKNHLNKVASKAGYRVEYINIIEPEQNDHMY